MKIKDIGNKWNSLHLHRQWKDNIQATDIAISTSVLLGTGWKVEKWVPRAHTELSAMQKTQRMGNGRCRSKPSWLCDTSWLNLSVPICETRKLERKSVFPDHSNILVVCFLQLQEITRDKNIFFLSMRSKTWITYIQSKKDHIELCPFFLLLVFPIICFQSTSI